MSTVIRACYGRVILRPAPVVRFVPAPPTKWWKVAISGVLAAMAATLQFAAFVLIASMLSVIGVVAVFLIAAPAAAALGFPIGLLAGVFAFSLVYR